MSPRRTLVVATAFLGLVFAGSAASAIPVRGVGQLGPDPASLRERLRTQFERSFAGIELPAVEPGKPGAPSPAATTAALPSADPFPGLGSGQFAGYASGTVNHTRAVVADKAVGRDINLASAHAAHSQGVVPRWNSEIARAAFPALAAGASHSKALAAELGEPDGEEEDSEIPVDPAVANAPPSSTPVVSDTTPIDVPPVLKNRSLRAEAAARAVKTGCVLGSDLALARANVDETEVGDLKGDPKSPAPFLSVNADEPPRAVAQSLARTRLVPIQGQPNRFGVLAETRQTIAPVTIFKGDKTREVTIEVAGEWILRVVADGTTGSVSLSVERTDDDDRPLLRIIGRDDKGKKVVTGIADLDELSNLERGGISLGGDLVLVLAEPARALRAPTGTAAVATGTRAAAALDILRIESGGAPEDALVRIGHMEAAVTVPPGGATCPGINITKRSSQPTVDAGGRFSWLLEISNPNDCVLDQVNLVDTTQPSKGLVYKVVATSPQGKVDGDKVTFEKIGPVPPGAKRSVRIDVEVDPGSAPGRFSNQALANGVCGSAAVSGTAEDETTVDPPTPLNLIGQGGANEPVVRTPQARTAEGAGGSSRSPGGDVIVRPAPAPRPSSTATAGVDLGSANRAETRRAADSALPRTGGAASGLLGIGLCALGILLRRSRRRPPSA